MNRKLASITFALGSLLWLSSAGNALGDDRIVYQWGFEDGLDEWQLQEPWEISDEDAQEGEFCAHCPVQANLRTGLVSRSMEIPNDGSRVYFQFWVRCDARMFDSDEDNFLDDYFMVQLSVEGRGWEDVIYDYGRDWEWMDNWIHYRPRTWFREDLPEWRVMLDLTQFAGQNLRLMWQFRTDEVMEGDQGSGIWIDNFELIATNDKVNDVGVEWLHFNYPTNQNTGLQGLVKVTNHGTDDQEVVRKFIRIDYENVVPIVPWNGLLADSSREYIVSLAEARIPNTGMMHFSAFTTLLVDDEDMTNDTSEAEVMVYPPNVWQLGYDDRRWSEPMTFDNGGPAVLFTPSQNNIEGQFDLYAIEALWSDEQRNEETATLTISRNAGGRPGEALHSEEITVTPGQVYPQKHYIDLADVESVKGLQGDFWVSIISARDGGFPRIMGRVPEGGGRKWGARHYFNQVGNNVTELDADFQLQAVLVRAEMDEADLVVQPNLYFGQVALNQTKRMALTIMGGSTAPVTIESVRFGNGYYSLGEGTDFPLELSVGEKATLEILCRPDREGEFHGDMRFTCNDQSPPFVAITGMAGRYPVIEVNPAEIDYGLIELGEAVEGMITIVNIGEANLVISDVSIDNRAFQIDFGEELTVEVGSEALIFPAFDPDETGRFNGLLTITSNDPVMPRVTIPLTGFVTGEGFPQIEQPIDDFRLAEDFEAFTLADLDTVFGDNEGDELFFDAHSEEDGIMVEVDGENRLMLSSLPNWSGESRITVFADDRVEGLQAPGGLSPLRTGLTPPSNSLQDRFPSLVGFASMIRPAGDLPGRDNITEMTFTVEVTPVNDEPAAFNLTSPPQGFIVERDRYEVEFEWESSSDVDGDEVVYGIHFDLVYGGIDTTVIVQAGESSEQSVALDNLLRRAGIVRLDRDTSMSVDWYVTASDGRAVIQSEERRNLTVPLPLGVNDQTQPFPLEFALEAPYPNPFNSTTTISFSLPRTGYYKLSVVDLGGREVVSLSEGWREAGSYRYVWNGDGLTSGQYVLRLNRANESYSRPITFIK